MEVKKQSSRYVMQRRILRDEHGHQVVELVPIASPASLADQESRAAEPQLPEGLCRFSGVIRVSHQTGAGIVTREHEFPIEGVASAWEAFQRFEELGQNYIRRLHDAAPRILRPISPGGQ